MVQSSFVKFCHVKFVQIFFLLQMLVETCKFRSYREDVLHLLHEYSVKLVNVFIDFTVWLLNFLKNAHVLLDNVHDVINVLPMVRYQGLFLLEDHFYQEFMVLANFLNIICIFLFDMLVGLQWHLS